MSFDGLFTRAMVKELSEIVTGGRITKIQQPFMNELVLTIRTRGKNHKLLLSVHPSYGRIQLTNEYYDSPGEPPMFCMLLRKHLEGYIVDNISQNVLERIITIEVKGRNDLGDITKKQLIVEIMGRHSNIILVEPERRLILDSIKHVSFSINRYRAILPGQEYIAPPAQDKVDPLTVTEKEIVKQLDFNGGKFDKQLVQQFFGVSPLLAKEIVFQAGLANRITLPKTCIKIFQQLKQHRYTPAITEGANKEYFYLFPLHHAGGKAKTFLSLSEMLDRFYFGKAERDRVKQQSNDLHRFVKNEKEKNEHKILKLQETLNDAAKKDQYQLFGELLTANMYALKKGMKQIEVINYYEEPNVDVLIPLESRKTPSENAQNYFKKYQKAKTALQIVKEQMANAEEEIRYFDGLLQQLDSASPKDIEEIREELTEQGYLRERQKGKKKKGKDVKPVLDRYVSSSGKEILVGKNNKQNDYLTTKLAGRDEIWLHTKDIPGSHVVVRSKSVDEQTLTEAAILAAYFSKARLSGSVPVDYTKVRYVKKPHGAKPGFVIYENQQTIFVTPDEEVVLARKQ
ncbi:NFACT family protein [Bacillaceae bacterium Marseille-Q3522]|nr:NFACT family protein [Bacillaceae bacterium Marseille-Q3522]